MKIIEICLSQTLSTLIENQVPVPVPQNQCIYHVFMKEQSGVTHAIQNGFEI